MKISGCRGWMQLPACHGISAVKYACFWPSTSYSRSSSSRWRLQSADDSMWHNITVVFVKVH